jgi:Ca2+-binding EF-hand superfamily protein
MYFFIPDESKTITKIQTAFRDRLGLPHVPGDHIRRCLLASDDDDETFRKEIEQLATQKWTQTQKAERAFTLLDVAKKDFVVVEDLQRVASEMPGEEVTPEQLEEMVHEFDQSGAGILTKDDLIRIAREIGL